MGGLTSKGWEPGKMGQNFARLHNIFQQEKHTEVGTVMEGLCVGTGSAWYRRQEVLTPLSLSLLVG